MVRQYKFLFMKTVAETCRFSLLLLYNIVDPMSLDFEVTFAQNQLFQDVTDLETWGFFFSWVIFTFAILD